MLNNYLKSYEDRRAFFFSFLAFLQASLMASSLGELGSQLCFCIQCAASPHAWQPLEHSFHLLMIHLLGAGAVVEFASAATLGQGVLSCDEGFSRKIQEMGSRQERQGPGNRKSGGLTPYSAGCGWLPHLFPPWPTASLLLPWCAWVLRPKSTAASP